MPREGQPNHAHRVVRARALSEFCRFETTLDTARHFEFFDVQSQDEAADAMEKALLAVNYLSCQARAMGEFAWGVLPKHHFSTHIAYDQAGFGVNPREKTCYRDEDIVGKHKIIVSACHGRTACQRSLQRYRVLFCTRLHSILMKIRFGMDIPDSFGITTLWND